MQVELGLGLGPPGPGAGVVDDDCVIAVVLSAIFTLPVRTIPPLEATLNLTEPLPLPVAADVIVIHGTSLAAVHTHPAIVETLIVPGPPAAVMVRVAGTTV